MRESALLRLLDIRKSLMVALLAVLVLAVVLPLCQMLACEMYGEMPSGPADGFAGAVCDALAMSSAAQPALTGSFASLLLLVAFALCASALALNSPRKLSFELARAGAPPSPQLDPLGVRILI